MKTPPKTPPKRPTWLGLSAELGYSRQAFAEWRTLAGAPQTPSLPRWKRFIAERGLGLAGNRVGSEREAVLTSTARKHERLLDLRIARETGAVVPKAELEGAAQRAVAATKRTLYAVLCTDLPLRLEGKSVAERRAILRAAADQVCDEMAALAGTSPVPTDKDAPPS